MRLKPVLINNYLNYEEIVKLKGQWQSLFECRLFSVEVWINMQGKWFNAYSISDEKLFT